MTCADYLAVEEPNLAELHDPATASVDHPRRRGRHRPGDRRPRLARRSSRSAGPSSSATRSGSPRPRAGRPAAPTSASSTRPTRAEATPTLIPCLHGDRAGSVRRRDRPASARGGAGGVRLPVSRHRPDACRRGRRHRHLPAAQGGAARGRACTTRATPRSSPSAPARSASPCCCTATALAVAHVTLHMALRDVFATLTTEAVPRTHRPARRAAAAAASAAGRGSRVAALNPHASDGGLFGDEEATHHRPGGGGRRRREGIDVERARGRPTRCSSGRTAGEFDGVVAMYHDQGHIAMKLRSGRRCVNITRRAADRPHQRRPRHRLRHRRPRRRRRVEPGRGGARRGEAGGAHQKQWTTDEHGWDGLNTDKKKSTFGPDLHYPSDPCSVRASSVASQRLQILDHRRPLRPRSACRRRCARRCRGPAATCRTPCARSMRRHLLRVRRLLQHLHLPADVLLVVILPVRPVTTA